MTSTTTQHERTVSQEPNLIIRILWFIFIGWWLSQLVILTAWLLNITIIGLPLGVFLLNRIPQLTTLKLTPVKMTHSVDDQTGAQTVSIASPEQRPFWVRALYFIFVGWWFSLIWLETAWLLSITIILLPLGFWMFGAAGKVLTLKR